MTEKLAPIFVNDTRVRVAGDPKPPVSKVVQACGMHPQAVDVYRLDSPKEPRGRKLDLEEIIDRTAHPNPIYLELFEREEESGHSTAGEAVEGGTTRSRIPVGEEEPRPKGPSPTQPSERPERGPVGRSRR